jgi:hypothetical protein
MIVKMSGILVVILSILNVVPTHHLDLTKVGILFPLQTKSSEERPVRNVRYTR